jgi:hypothetical protein
VPCAKCDGEGIIRCSECGNEYECEACDGVGDVPSCVKINDCYYQYRYVLLLMKLDDIVFAINKNFLIAKWKKGGAVLSNCEVSDKYSKTIVQEITL